ncbi:MAG TPA: helix-turn-helix domain-containing protein [Myxococcaceae bacterium]|nr:helix-turn-helix domain-containing protein [Myxococcaceae bacterium]
MKRYTEQSYYELLEVPPGATVEEIRAAYQRAARLYDVDSVALYPVGDPARVEELKKLLLEAVEVLSDPALRARYDHGLGIGTNGVHVVPALAVASPPVALSDPLELPPVDSAPGSEPAPPARLHAAAWPSFLPPATPPPLNVSPESPARAPPAPLPISAPEEHAAAPAGSARPPPLRRALETAPVLAQESAIADAESALAQVQAQVANRPREARPRGLELPADAVFNGELLRQVRKTKGMTLQVLADRTRISTRHLENVEADRYDALPATVYLRGILMNIARELGLDALRVSKGYLSLIEKPTERK